MSVATGSLEGRRVVTTRDEPGRLEELLGALGIDVVHVPLIEIVDAPGDALADALDRIHEFDWVAVTSQHGAARVAPALVRHPDVRTAAVGTRTAAVVAELAGRPVTVVPDRQTAADLAAALPDPGPGDRRILVAQADRADPLLVERLRSRGYDVEAVVAYSTRLRAPTPADLGVVRDADAVVFASGSAAEAWAQAIGTATPPLVIVIGPTTARAATEAGLQVTSVAADHSLEGLASEVAAALATLP